MGDNDSLAARRVAFERSALAGRLFGVAALVALAPFVRQEPYTQFVIHPWHVVGGAIAALLVAAAAGVGSIRYVEAHAYQPIGALCVALDTLVFVAGFALLESDPALSGWPLLIVPLLLVFAGGHGWRWSISVAVAEVTAVVLVTGYGQAITGHPGSTVEAIAGSSVLLVLGHVLGARSSASNRQLAELTRTRWVLAHQATHDPLTDLGNRSMLRQFCEGLQQHRQERLAVLAFDLDGFKDINDTRGHASGDEILCTVARRIVSNVRSSDIVVRLGGDEFLVLMPDSQPVQAQATLTRLLAAVSAPIQLTGGDVEVGTSVGLAIGPASGADDVDLLLAAADRAMYRMKAAARPLAAPSRHPVPAGVPATPG